MRLQCYEGLNTGAAVYERNYPRQMIEIRLRRPPVSRATSCRTTSSRRNSAQAPLQAIDPDDGVPPVLLIDELDRTDEPFEAHF